ncbi:hypothetical protein ABZ079_27690 [Streptomyces sp. NPDC006314]|uniref:hypothetical protein n=1 Tax=Streptomyces sp. NPDC006314 TaxID=3154475 RepID=UPI0033A08469
MRSDIAFRPTTRLRVGAAVGSGGLCDEPRTPASPSAPPAERQQHGGGGPAEFGSLVDAEQHAEDGDDEEENSARVGGAAIGVLRTAGMSPPRRVRMPSSSRVWHHAPKLYQGDWERLYQRALTVTDRSM